MCLVHQFESSTLPYHKAMTHAGGGGGGGEAANGSCSMVILGQNTPFVLRDGQLSITKWTTHSAVVIQHHPSAVFLSSWQVSKTKWTSIEYWPLKYVACKMGLTCETFLTDSKNTIFTAVRRIFAEIPVHLFWAVTSSPALLPDTSAGPFLIEFD